MSLPPCNLQVVSIILSKSSFRCFYRVFELTIPFRYNIIPMSIFFQSSLLSISIFSKISTDFVRCWKETVALVLSINAGVYL